MEVVVADQDIVEGEDSIQKVQYSDTVRQKGEEEVSVSGIIIYKLIILLFY